jgi:hypothetical protein
MKLGINKIVFSSDLLSTSHWNFFFGRNIISEPAVVLDFFWVIPNIIPQEIFECNKALVFEAE